MVLGIDNYNRLDHKLLTHYCISKLHVSIDKNLNKYINTHYVSAHYEGVVRAYRDNGIQYLEKRESHDN